MSSRRMVHFEEDLLIIILNRVTDVIDENYVYYVIITNLNVSIQINEGNVGKFYYKYMHQCPTQGLDFSTQFLYNYLDSIKKHFDLCKFGKKNFRILFHAAKQPLYTQKRYNQIPLF